MGNKARIPGYQALQESPFKTFWMGGFECTDKLNAFGNRVDFLTLTGHLQKISQDYRKLRPFNIGTVREGIRWSQVEKSPYQYDWTTVAYMLEQGKALGVQQVWDLCHFGYPDDLTPLHPLFARRFAAMCRAFVQFYRSAYPDDILIVTPINEVSFISWLGGDVRATSPYCVGHGWEVKYGLMRAYIEGVAAMRELDPNVRIMTTEPLVNVVPPLHATAGEQEEAQLAHALQYQAADMLCGRMCPELGGNPDYLDILGLNYYYNNQWETGTHTRLPWLNEHNDPRWRPLHSLLAEVHARYQKPVVLAETSHPGVHRPNWIRFVTDQCAAALQAGVPLWGICLYPVIDRPDWDHLQPWHNAGLWDAAPRRGKTTQRLLHKPYAEALLEAQALLQEVEASGKILQTDFS
ncbi:amine oxidase [Pontibacter liquoris]|uniref:amine oxidase n=1 Tax=Pontibacter liquoris TaxID=2905677 RepID=UPI001FA8169B|nr:amine oxidase [Pontibacter liquoris]